MFLVAGGNSISRATDIGFDIFTYVPFFMQMFAACKATAIPDQIKSSVLDVEPLTIHSLFAV